MIKYLPHNGKSVLNKGKERRMNHIKRREFLKAIGWGTLYSLSGCVCKKPKEMEIISKESDEEVMKLRPHHILDIVRGYGAGVEYKPHRYGHSQHIVAKKILSELDTKIQLVVAADAICQGCKHLLPNGKCDDVIPQITPSPSKQAYNDVLDCRLLDYLNIELDSVMTVREYLNIVNSKVPGIEKICTHFKEDPEKRLSRMTKGLIKLGIREAP
jgi:hypothetical protein